MKKKNRLKIERVKVLIIVKTYFKNLLCAEFYDQILNEKEILQQVHKSDKYFFQLNMFVINNLPVNRINVNDCLLLN
jgi:hypothetical protein